MSKNNEEKVINIDAISKDHFCLELRKNNIWNKDSSKAIKIDLDANTFSGIDTLYDLKIINSNLNFTGADVVEFNNVTINDSIIENVEDKFIIKDAVVENTTIKFTNNMEFTNVEFINCKFEDFEEYQFIIDRLENVVFDEKTKKQMSNGFKTALKLHEL